MPLGDPICHPPPPPPQGAAPSPCAPWGSQVGLSPGERAGVRHRASRRESRQGDTGTVGMLLAPLLPGLAGPGNATCPGWGQWHLLHLLTPRDPGLGMGLTGVPDQPRCLGQPGWKGMLWGSASHPGRGLPPGSRPVPWLARGDMPKVGVTGEEELGWGQDGGGSLHGI